jgi:hypothetical protein
MNCRPRRLINEQGKSALSMYVVFTSLSCVVLFLPIFLLKRGTIGGGVRSLAILTLKCRSQPV